MAISKVTIPQSERKKGYSVALALPKAALARISGLEGKITLDSLCLSIRKRVRKGMISPEKIPFNGELTTLLISSEHHDCLVTYGRKYQGQSVRQLVARALMYSEPRN
jgi:hypothetical protein